MGLITGLVPNAAASSSASCHTLNANPIDYNILRRPSLAKSGTAINIEITEPEFEGTRSRRQSIVPSSSAVAASYSITSGRRGGSEFLMPIAFNSGFTTSSSSGSGGTTTLELKVNFQLPANRRPSIAVQQQPTLRERIKGSPRFPHRILPTGSLNALMDDEGKPGGVGGK